MTNVKAMVTKMSSQAVIGEARRMSRFLLDREYRGPGDTIEAAAYRIQTRYGVPVATTMRLRNRDVKDMFVSSLAPILNAYLSITDKVNAAADRMERAYEDERNLALDPRMARLADLVRGAKTEQTEGEVK